MYCSECGRDINEIGQDNVSCISDFPLCEDCGSDYHMADGCYIGIDLASGKDMTGNL